jgi:hypothetical protein
MLSNYQQHGCDADFNNNVQPNCHDITEILLKVVLNTITLTFVQFNMHLLPPLLLGM